MKISARLLTLALVVVPAVPAMAASTGGTTAAPAAATVARDRSAPGPPPGRAAETPGRGLPRTVRTVSGGAVRFVAGKTGRYAGFPAPCARSAKTCPRALLEAGNDADL